jgi:PKD repeat protein
MISTYLLLNGPLAWNAVANATGYKLHYVQGGGSYSPTADAGNQMTYTVPSLTDGARYHFAVTAYGPAGTTDSGYSSEVSTVVESAAPVATFSASPINDAAPLAVTFTDTSTVNVTSRSGNLGDGTTATAATVAKTYLTSENSTGAPRITEAVSPFDFARTLSDVTAAALDTAALTKGVHTASAQVTLNDGTSLPVLTGTFRVP